MEGGSDSPMIEEIHAENIALIRSVDLQPAESLTVITGETGAGKSALLASCRLLMGERAERDMVRDGEDEALVQGCFLYEKDSLSADNPLAEHAPVSEGSPEIEVVVTRRVTKECRSRVKIDSELASVGDLSKTIGATIDLCSQHDQQKLMNVASQRGLLLSWGADVLGDLPQDYATSFQRTADARAHLEEIQELKRTSDEKVERARFVLDQIEKVDPRVEDYEELTRVLNTSENAEALKRATEDANEALSGEDGVLDRLTASIQVLDSASTYDESLGSHANSLREASYLIEDVARDIATYASSIELDVSELEFFQARVADYQTLMRTYGPELSDVIARAEKERQIVDAHENSDLLEEEAERELTRAREELMQVAGEFARCLSQLAPQFTDEVTEHMQELNMGSAELVCAVEDLPEDGWTAEMPVRIEFLFKPTSGMQARPLSKIASGGELSRVMLSIHAVMGEKDQISTLVFDEIDAGVGGAVAKSLAELLRKLARTHQVLVVTHLPQVAAVADKHYVVEKAEQDGFAETHLREVKGEEKVSEIARMLSGSTTDTSLAHARELLGANA